MGKFCPKCGKEMNGSGAFCPACGHKTAEKEVQQESVPEKDMAKSVDISRINVKKWGILGGALLIVIIVAVAIFGGGKGYEKPFRALEEGFNQLDIAKIQEAFPPAYTRAMDEDVLDDLTESIKDNGSIKYEIDVINKQKIKGKEMKQYLQNEVGIGMQGVEVDTVKQCYIVSIQIKAEAGDDEDEGEINNIPVIKSKGSWYIVPTDDFNIL